MITPEGLNGYRKEAQNIIKYGHKCASMDNPTVIGESMVHLLDVIDRLTTELAEVMEEAKVWQDRYRKRGYVMDEHAKALERAEIAEAELARYKSGVEVGAIVRSRGTSYAGFDYYVEIPMPKHTSGQRVRVLIMKEEG